MEKCALGENTALFETHCFYAEKKPVVKFTTNIFKIIAIFFIFHLMF